MCFVNQTHLKPSPQQANRLLPDAVEEAAAADEELVAGEGGGGVKAVVEFVGGEDFQFLGALEDEGDSVAAGDVNFSGAADEGTVDVGDVAQAFAVEMGFAGLGVGDGKEGLVGLAVK